MFKIIQADLTQAEHAKAYLKLMSDYACDPMGGGEDLSDFAKQNLIETLLKRNDVFIVLAFKNGQAAAILTAIEGFSTFACKPLLNIHDVAVCAAFRGQGVTNLLFSEIEKIALSRGCCKMTLEVLEGNEIAINAYRKQGFCGYQLDPKFGNALFWTKSLHD
ncbi:GNAT family N-acetyltransferase [Psychromonas antarctica]|uniref:GNAT family N-acetyltransferase n=1 Tax=Psychromonas antarctica TaxID=67573 RepID=UPI001EE85E85|nr:GNAT family N-acetyltransferase [Psychromonas antarctica]MCG6200086.1 GNAT family N-acetyltransferase [Psychromonas antarctica]